MINSHDRLIYQFDCLHAFVFDFHIYEFIIDHDVKLSKPTTNKRISLTYNVSHDIVAVFFFI